jgi:hypothetical protein
MKNLTIVIGSVALLAVAGFAAAVYIPLPGHHQGKLDADVTLTGTGTACTPMNNVGRIGGYKNDKINWKVVNNCDSVQYVTFLVYREELGGNSYGQPEHVVDPDPVSSKSLAASGGKDNVDAKIDKDNPNFYFDKVYKYFICVGTTPNPVPDPIKNPSPQCLDPDADVWP